jgi:hypothetical protein
MNVTLGVFWHINEELIQKERFCFTYKHTHNKCKLICMKSSLRIWGLLKSVLLCGSEKQVLFSFSAMEYIRDRLKCVYAFIFSCTVLFSMFLVTSCAWCVNPCSESSLFQTLSYANTMTVVICVCYRDAVCNVAKTYTCFVFHCSNGEHIHTILQSIGKYKIVFVIFLFYFNLI